MKHSIAWFAAIVLTLGAVSVSKTAGSGPYGMDASYYYQIARHIARGDGLITTTSLYHEGWHLPAQSRMYPLWPLVFGYAGRVMGMVPAANVVPKVFYILDLALLYFLCRAVALRLGALRFTSHWFAPDSAHLTTLLLGLNSTFFAATTHPYREGIAFAAAFGSLLALERFASRKSAASIALSGMFAGLAYLGRIQMAAVGVAIFSALAFFAIRDRRHRLALLLFTGAMIAVAVPWFVFLGTIPQVPSLGGGDTAALREILPVLHDPPVSRTAGELVRDAMIGLGQCFLLGSPYAYTATFGVAAFLVPISVVVAGMTLRRDLRLAQENATVIAATMAGALMFVALLVHRSTFLPFYFGWRHGLTLIFLLIVSVPIVMRRWRGVALMLIALSIIEGGVRIAAFVRRPDPSYSRGERELARWVSAQPKPVTLLTTNAQILSVIADAHFHGTFCASTPEATRVFLRKLRVEYVVVYERETRCPFLAGLGNDLRVVRTFGPPGDRLYLLGRSANIGSS